MMRIFLLTGLALLLLTEIALPQSTILKLPTNDNTSSFKITKSDSSEIFELFGDGGFYFGSGTNGVVPVEGEGRRLLWHPRKAAFRAGWVQGTEWDEFSIGLQSLAAGRNTTASGENSTALGTNTVASGYSSIALGTNSTASGNISAALGFNSTASAATSTAIGLSTIASGNYSTAMGSYVSTNEFDGSFFIGDFSTWDPINGSVTHTSSAENQMSMRFAGGYRFFTNSDADVGALLDAGGNSWTTISDSTKKENFIYADGEKFLNNLSKLRLGSWNYKSQDPKHYRHYGPMAQEIFHYFGNDELGNIGNDTTLSTADIDGIIMICLQALEKRTTELQNAKKEISELKEKFLSFERKYDLLINELLSYKENRSVEIIKLNNTSEDSKVILTKSKNR